MSTGGILTNFLALGALWIVLACVIFLIILFGIAPLPYIISAAVLKIPNRGYWKAFGSAILGGLAGSATATVVVLITAAITGSFATLRNATGFGGFFGLIGGTMIIGWLIGWAGSIVVQMAITGALYQVGFGKGALIWLLAAVFGFLIGVVIMLIMFVISAAAVGSFYNAIINFFRSGNLQYYIPSLLLVV